MQNSTNQDDALHGATDGELETLLAEAYESPAIPRSLLKRIDRVVEQEWGVSPELSRREPSRLGRAVTRGSRMFKVWSIAASLALIGATFVIFQNNAHAYGWSKMLEALSRASVVQIAEPDGAAMRWMSVSRGVVGERSAEGSRVYDFAHGETLEREAGNDLVRRRSFEVASNATAAEAIVFAFFLNNVVEQGSTVRQSEFQVVDESWSSAGENVWLQVELGSDADTAMLRILVDRDTHLPQRFEVVAATSAADAVALSYPQVNATQLLAKDFPSHLPKVDVVSADAALAGYEPPSRPATPGDSVAARAGAPANPSTPNPRDSNLPTAPNGSAGPNGPNGNNNVANAPPLVGAASLQWKAVPVVKSTTAEAVAALDAILEGLWKDKGVDPAPPADPEELLRRVYLDLAGRTPSVSEVRAYLADESPDRYQKLVERLLGSRDHSTHLATVWRTYLIPEGIDLARFGGPQSFEKWIGEQFAKGVSYDEIVRQLLRAEGRLVQSGPLLFYAAVKMDPDQLAMRSARVFLGMRLDCAQCHDDRFEPFLQEDFWSYAAFFAQISRPQGVLRDVSTVMRVHDIDRGEVTLPDSEKKVAPRFLDGSPMEQEAAPRRQQLAEWLTAAENPYFARATVNRIWGQLFGKGIVDPVDGFGTQHRPVSQDLLDRLASHFVGSGFDLRELMKTIVLSRAYRLSSGAPTVDPQRHELFAQMNVKLLTAEQMYDCIAVASMLATAGSDTEFNLDRVGNTSRDLFLQQFRAPPGRSTEYQAGIPQALTLMNGGLISSATSLRGSGLLKTLEVPLITNSERVEILYLATLSRKPTAAERELLGEYIGEDAAGSELYESLADVLWALLNSAEFTMNH